MRNIPERLAKSLHVIGLINIQFIVVGEDVYVIEVNPRSSRTVPYISKVTGIPIVDLRHPGYHPEKQSREAGLRSRGLLARSRIDVAVKMPVFSFEKIRGAEISLGPEMKSTGECLGTSLKPFMKPSIRLSWEPASICPDTSR